MSRFNACFPRQFYAPVTLTDANGTWPGDHSRLYYEYAWPDLAFGPSKQATISIDLSQEGTADGATVYCGHTLQKVSGKTLAITLKQGMASGATTYVCRVFVTATFASQGDGVRPSPNWLKAEAWTCPPGQDPAGDWLAFKNACTVPAPGMEVAVIRPDQYVKVAATSNANPASLTIKPLGLGPHQVVFQPVAGSQRVTFCWREGIKGSFRVDAVGFTLHLVQWESGALCRSYLILAAAQHTPPDIAGQVAAMPIDSTRLSGARRRAASLARHGRSAAGDVPSPVIGWWCRWRVGVTGAGTRWLGKGDHGGD